MIPEKELEMLIKNSKRDDDFELVLKEDASKEAVKLAKKYHWKPYDVIMGVKYSL